MINKHELYELAEKQRKHLPTAFFTELEAMKVDMAMGHWPEQTRAKGRRSRWRPQLRAAILLELHALLCSDDPKYKNVRAHGGKVGILAVGAITGYVCGVIGEANTGSGAIVGAVAFITLTVANIGKNAFCRLPIPLLENAHNLRVSPSADLEKQPLSKSTKLPRQARRKPADKRPGK